MVRVADEIRLDGPGLDALKAGCRGEVIVAGDERYDAARAVWNGSIDRYPAVVIACRGVADIKQGIAFARERDLPVAIRGGGHNVAGLGTCDGGVVLDLSPMQTVRVDPEARTASCDPGVVGGGFDRETQAFGLATTLGVMSTTGVAGLTLGGGIGWLQRRFGYACDNLLAADVLTADGDLVHASEEENPELFWGLRGGGGNFGVVTNFTFRIHPVGPPMFCGLTAWPAEDAAAVFRHVRDVMEDAPDELQVIPILRTAPAAPFLPEAIHGKPIIAVAGCYSGDLEDAEEAFAPIRNFGSPAGDAFAVRPYATFQSMFDGSWAPGFRNYWKGEYLNGMPDELIDIVAEYAVRHSSPLSDFKFPRLGGQVARVPEDATACGFRDAPWFFAINTRWAEPGEDDRHIEHSRALFEAIQPYSAGGAYVNFVGEEGEDRVRESYGDDRFLRLQKIKGRWDPENVFRINQNIPPAR